MEEFSTKRFEDWLRAVPEEYIHLHPKDFRLLWDRTQAGFRKMDTTDFRVGIVFLWGRTIYGTLFPELPRTKKGATLDVSDEQMWI